MHEKSHHSQVISTTARETCGRGAQGLTRALAGLGLLLLAACGDDEMPGGTASEDDNITNPEPVCVNGHQVACACPGGGEGIQECMPNGAGYGSCQCPEDDTTGNVSGSDSDSGTTITMGCGDGVCDDAEGETCQTCEEDCGGCGLCLAAPPCEGVLIPGIIDTHLPALDLHTMNSYAPGELKTFLENQVKQGSPSVRVLATALAAPSERDDPLSARLRALLEEHPEQAAKIRAALARAGLERPEAYRARLPVELQPRPSSPAIPATEPDDGQCLPPRLRLRVAKLIVHEEQEDIPNDVVYCAIVSEANTAAELRLLAPTPPLDEGQEHAYALAEGVIWGQDMDVVDPGGNMLITYNCFEQDSVEGWQALLDAVGDAADGLGGLPGDLGWIFPSIGALAELIGAALAFESDDHLFNASQIIPKELHLEMTNGRWWGVRQSGKDGLSDWDWELRVESWGCADNGAAPVEP